MNFIVQTIGIMAWILLTISYWQKKKLNLILLQISSYILYAIHFAFLNASSGMLCNIAGIVVLFLLLIKEKSNKKCYWLLPLILLLYIPIGKYFYEKWYSILPIAASIIPLLCNWQTNSIIIKIGGLIGAFVWLVYGFYINSQSTIITNIIFIIVTIVSLIVNKEKNKNY